MAFDNYLTVSWRAKDIARVTAKAITDLAREGLNVDTLHIVGHSMGAQIAGFIGQFLNFKIPRITGIVLFIFKSFCYYLTVNNNNLNS